jgi:putative DNA primase/helicase
MSELEKAKTCSSEMLFRREYMEREAPMSCGAVAVLDGKVGRQLTQGDLEHLAESWIDAALAGQAHLCRVTTEEAEGLGLKYRQRGYSGLLFPFFLPGHQNPVAYRLRADIPPVGSQDQRGLFKYLSAVGSANRLYFVPGTLPEECSDTSLPVAIVESEKKTLALYRLAHHNADRSRFLSVGITGIWNWRGVNGRTMNACGTRVDTKGPIGDLGLLAWQDRIVYLVFDADSKPETRKNTERARKSLASELAGRGAQVRIVSLGLLPGSKKTGADDYLMAKGPETMLRLFEGATEFKKYVPFDCRDDGVWWIDDNPDPEKRHDVWICGPLEIEAVTSGLDGFNHGRLLSWAYDHNRARHSWAMPMELLAGDGCDLRRYLLSGGLPISSNRRARELLFDYLQFSQPSRSMLCVDRVGWHGEVFVLPDGTIGPADCVERVFQGTSSHRYRTAGTLEQWRSEVARICAGNSRLIFCLCLAFAGPLLALTGTEGGGFHLYGTTSTGKTTAQMVAGSVWGGNDIHGFLSTWRGTNNGLEALAELHNDTLLVLDELKQSSAKDVAEMIYLLANGQAKHRMSRAITARSQAAWRLLFLSSGELTLEQHLETVGQRNFGGLEVRLINLPADAGTGRGLFDTVHGGEDASEFAGRLQAAAKHFYGTAGRAWLKWLVSNREVVRDDFRLFHRQFVTRVVPAVAVGELPRAAGRFALAAAAGELATEVGITGWQEGESVKAAEVLWKAWMNQRGLKSTDEASAIRQVRAFIEAHGSSRFQKLLKGNDGNALDSQEKVVDRAGFYEITPEGSTYLILPEVFRKEVCRGHDFRMVAGRLVDRGFLEKGNDGRFTRLQRLPGMGVSRVYRVNSSIFNEEHNG